MNMKQKQYFLSEDFVYHIVSHRQRRIRLCCQPFPVQEFDQTLNIHFKTNRGDSRLLSSD